MYFMASSWYGVVPSTPLARLHMRLTAHRGRELLVEWVGQSHVRFQDRPDLDGAQVHGRKFRRQLDGLIQVPGVNDSKPAQELLRLGKRTIADGQLAVPAPQRRGAPHRLEARRKDVVTALFEFADPGATLAHERFE